MKWLWGIIDALPAMVLFAILIASPNNYWVS